MGVVQAEAMDLARSQAASLEMEPLEVVAVAVLADVQVDVRRVAGVQDQDVAGVEIAVDVQRGERHGHCQPPVGVVVGGTLHRERCSGCHFVRGL